MAIKGADLLHVGDRVLLERAQTAGPGQVNLSPEKVYELGNYRSIATIYDIPDLTFSIDSLDTSTSLEALLVGANYGTSVVGDVYDLSRARPLDILSEFKRGRADANPYNVAASAALPYLTLEQVNYRFGLKEKAQQTAVLKGDSIFYNPGSAFQDHVAGTGAPNQSVVLAQPAYPYNGAVIDGVKYALGVKLASGKRLRFGSDYTEAVTGTATDGSRSVTLTILAPVATTDFIDVVYSSPTVAQYPQASHTLPQVTRPAAIRGRDIEVYVGGIALSNRWTSVQAVTCDYRVTLQKDEEFGNAQLVDQDFDVPAVNGTIQIKPRDVFELLTRVRQAAGIAANATEVVGALSTTPLEVVFVLHAPQDGSILKSLVIPDARITVPAFSGRVQQKLDVTFNFESDTGQLQVIHGAKPAS